MSKSDGLETDLLELFFHGTTITSLADDTATSPSTALYVGLHTGSPGDGGNQTTSESTYTSYARVAVDRTSTAWSVVNNGVSPIATVSFPQATGGSETVSHFSVGLDASGAGTLLYHGTVTPNITVSNGVTPELTTSSSITED